MQSLQNPMNYFTENSNQKEKIDEILIEKHVCPRGGWTQCG